MKGPANIPRLLAKENQENALAWVFTVLFSEIILLTVLDSIFRYEFRLVEHIDLHHGPCKGSSDASEKNHLPQVCAQSE